MTNVASALAFLSFAALALALAVAPPAYRPRLASVLILYAIVATATAALTSRDFWPFSSWHMMQTLAPTEVGPPRYRIPRLVAVTASGVESRVDYRAWEPLEEDELTTWLKFDFPSLPGDAQDRIAAYLLERANAARAAVRAGHQPGSFARLLGPLAAPTHLVHAKRWIRPGDVPDQPFVELRVYEERWVVEARYRDSHEMQLILVYRYRREP